MLKKENRLRKTKEIEKVFLQGKKINSDNLIVYFRENTLGVNRFAFSVSKKITKKAVTRNKIKRWLREITRQTIIPILKKKIDKSFDFLLVAKNNILNQDFHTLEKELKVVVDKVISFQKK